MCILNTFELCNIFWISLVCNYFVHNFCSFTHQGNESIIVSLSSFIQDNTGFIKWIWYSFIFYFEKKISEVLILGLFKKFGRIQSWVPLILGFLLGILLISFSISLLVINMFNIFISSEFNFGMSDTLLALQNINFKVFLNNPIDFIRVCCYNSPFTFTSINWDFFPILFTNLARGLSILLPFKENNFLASSIYWRLVGLCFIKSCFNLYGFFSAHYCVWEWLLIFLEFYGELLGY